MSTFIANCSEERKFSVNKKQEISIDFLLFFSSYDCDFQLITNVFFIFHKKKRTILIIHKILYFHFPNYYKIKKRTHILYFRYIFENLSKFCKKRSDRFFSLHFYKDFYKKKAEDLVIKR